ncbi:MAG: ribosome silencing factor [Kiritimatiellae bacterium]|jgi:ribosome-associated protein|nr:ribosome silencing factor [Kiritimatiellia bacterium]
MKKNNPAPAETKLTAVDLARLAAAAISEKQGVDIIAYDVSGVSSIADYYLVASGQNTAHLKALCNETSLVLKSRGINCWRQSGRPESGWVVADYVDFIIHFFKKDVRAYYAIDRLWENMPRLDIPLPGHPPG